jgi:formylglycine-generating enzyme
MVKSFGFLLAAFAAAVTLAPLACGAAAASADDPSSDRSSARGESGDKGTQGSDRNARSAPPPAGGPLSGPLTGPGAELDPRGGSENGCPQGMASVDHRFCVDRYEASLIEVLPNGEERAWSPYQSVDGHVVRAVSSKKVYPQGYISAQQAGKACERSGKRLCKAAEWKTACRGPSQTTYGYGEDDSPGRCNDHGRSPVSGYTWKKMNNPTNNQLPGTLSRTGDHDGCTNAYGVYDMVGNLHEWVADADGTFQGGFYQDVHQHGDGCGYVTTAHNASYHDYSTGFRCCADPMPGH